MKRILAIDPGASGGLAWTSLDTIQSMPMPDGMTAQADQIREIAVLHPGIEAVVERVGTYRPGNSGPAAATFARHCGHLDAILYMAGIPVRWNPTPQTWMKSMGALPKDKMERKRAIKELMARRYPHLTVTLKTADALGILTWANREGGGVPMAGRTVSPNAGVERTQKAGTGETP
jgi:hypothetical protein